MTILSRDFSKIGQQTCLPQKSGCCFVFFGDIFQQWTKELGQIGF